MTAPASETAAPVIAELVACKDLKDSIVNSASPAEAHARDAEYRRRKPLAWGAARAWLAGQATPPVAHGLPIRGVRVEGETVIVTVMGGNDAARFVCGALVDGMSKPDERDRLRAAQDAAVMPMIGPLLDAYEGAKGQLCEEFDGLAKHLSAINRAMEEAGDPCRMCNGHGMVGYPTGHPAADSQPCPDCKGSGEVAFEVYAGPEVIDDGMRNCDACNGTGSAAPPHPDDVLTVASIKPACGGAALFLEADQLGDLIDMVGREEQTYTVRVITGMRRADFDALGEFDGF